jgi:hypothetical protein
MTVTMPAPAATAAPEEMTAPIPPSLGISMKFSPRFSMADAAMATSEYDGLPIPDRSDQVDQAEADEDGPAVVVFPVEQQMEYGHREQDDDQCEGQQYRQDYRDPLPCPPEDALLAGPRHPGGQREQDDVGGAVEAYRKRGQASADAICGDLVGTGQLSEHEDVGPGVDVSVKKEKESIFRMLSQSMPAPLSPKVPPR